MNMMISDGHAEKILSVHNYGAAPALRTDIGRERGFFIFGHEMPSGIARLARCREARGAPVERVRQSGFFYAQNIKRTILRRINHVRGIKTGTGADLPAREYHPHAFPPFMRLRKKRHHPAAGGCGCTRLDTYPDTRGEGGAGMSGDMVKVINKSVERIFYREIPVVTFRMVDELHRKKEGATKLSFHRHRLNFIEGEDYFNLPHAEWSKMIAVTESNRDIQGQLPLMDPCRNGESKQRNPMIFLTESGYLLVTKPFTDAFAWMVQRSLINGYFAAKRLRYDISGGALDRQPLDDFTSRALGEKTADDGLSRRFRNLVDFARREGLKGAFEIQRMISRLGHDSDIIDRIVYYRKLGLTQCETAKLLDISRSMVQDYEKLLKRCGHAMPYQGRNASKFMSALPFGGMIN